MSLATITPGMIVHVVVPWGTHKPYSLVRARVMAVRHDAEAKPGGFAPRPVTVEWIETPPIPGGHSRRNTFDFESIRVSPAERDPWF